MPIFCDESGYTGHNLLVNVQPFFVYAALKIEESEAIDFCKYLKSKYYLQGELKGTNLVRSTQGKQAIRDLFERYSPVVRIVYYHKKYALACKFYEYVFEPVIADKNSFFYHYQFNYFISNLVYSTFNDKNDTAEDIFLRFQELLRGNDLDGLFTYLKSINNADHLIDNIAQFAITHKKKILDEITTNGEIDSWILDLSQTALSDLLCFWSAEEGGLSTICDDSEPLLKAVSENPFFYNSLDEVKYWNPLGRGKVPLNFILSEPIKFLSSKKSKGLQLADLFASSVNWALRNPDETLAKFIQSYLPDITARTDNRCIVPEPQIYLKPGTVQFDFGVTALNRLNEFSLIDSSNVLNLFQTWLENGTKTYKKR